jgi:membrane dipeptidase
MIIIIMEVLIIGCQEQAPTLTDTEMKKKANELAQKYMIVDTHQDVPYRLMKKMEDISQRTEEGEFDYPRARRGGLDVVFMAVYVPAEYEDKGGAKAFAEQTIDITEGLADTWPDKFLMAGSVADVKKRLVVVKFLLLWEWKTARLLKAILIT